MEKRHQNTRFSVRALILVLMLLRDLNENFWRGGHTWSFELSLLNTKDLHLIVTKYTFQEILFLPVQTCSMKKEGIAVSWDKIL